MKEREVCSRERHTSRSVSRSGAGVEDAVLLAVELVLVDRTSIEAILQVLERLHPVRPAHGRWRRRGSGCGCRLGLVVLLLAGRATCMLSGHVGRSADSC